MENFGILFPWKSGICGILAWDVSIFSQMIVFIVSSLTSIMTPVRNLLSYKPKQRIIKCYMTEQCPQWPLLLFCSTISLMNLLKSSRASLSAGATSTWNWERGTWPGQSPLSYRESYIITRGFIARVFRSLFCKVLIQEKFEEKSVCTFLLWYWRQLLGWEWWAVSSCPPT